MARQVAVNLTANPSAFIAGFGRAEAAAVGLDAKMLGLSRNMKTLGGVFLAFEGVKVFGGLAKQAGDFQAQITRLKTDANESAKSLGSIAKGVIALSNATGTSTTELNAGLYKIESAGIHGAAALKVAQAAAEGARVGFADLTTVSDALTTAMTDYHLPASAATATTNELIATVSRGKTTLEDLSASLSKVAPAAATAGITLSQLLGAMATMTAQGTNANLAATYLRQTILQLSNPTAKARTEMENLGLSAIDVSSHLGDRGLTGTFQMLTDAIQKRMGPAGTIFIKSLQEASKNTTSWQQVLANMSASQQTYVAALADMTGGTKSLQAVLELTGANSATFAKNAQEIGDSTQGAGAHVKDWDVIQKNFNQKLAEAKTRFHNLGLVLGQEILPTFTTFAGYLSSAAGWLTKYPKLVEGVTFTLLGAGGLILGLKLAAGALNLVTTAMARSVALRTAMTGGLLAQGAAADKAAGSFARLAVAENSVGLRTALGGPLAKLGLAGAAATGGETAAIGGMSTAALGAAIAAPIVLSLGSVFALYKIDQANADPSARNDRSGKGPNFNNPVNAGVVAPGAIGGSYSIVDQIIAQAEAKAAPNAVQPHQANGLGAGGAVQARQMQNRVAEQQKLTQITNNLAKANDGLDKTVRVTTASMIANTGVMDGVHAQTVGLSGATGTLTTHLGTIAKAMQGAKDKATALAAGIAALSGNAIDASRAQDGFQQQINDLTASFDKNTKSLVGTSNAAIQNRGLVDEAAQAAQQHAEAVLKQTGNVDKAKSALLGDAKALQAHLEATTGNKKAADDFLASIHMMPAQVASAFDGLHKVGETYGGQLVDGFAGGIQQHLGDAVRASTIVVEGAKKVFTTNLKIQSPSKVTHQYGGWVATGFANGMKDGSKKSEAAAKSLANKATSILRTEIKDGLTLAERVLQTSISSLTKKIDAARSRLSNLQGQRSSAMQSAKGVFTSTGDLSNIVGATIKGTTTTNWDGTSNTTQDTTAPITAASLNAGLSAIAGKDKDFITKMKRLHGKNGLTEATWISILNMGPDAGLPYVDAILSGGQSEINTVNSLEGQISQYGNQAASMAGAPYGAAIDRQTKALDKMSQKLDEFKHELAAERKFSLTLNLDDSVAKLKKDLAEFERRTGMNINLKLRTG